jgi:hypothetical protein
MNGFGRDYHQFLLMASRNPWHILTFSDAALTTAAERFADFIRQRKTLGLSPSIRSPEPIVRQHPSSQDSHWPQLSAPPR